MLYNVDDLRAQAEQNRRQRQKGVDPALVIIERETAACYALLRHQQAAGAVLQPARRPRRRDPPRELDALFDACPASATPTARRSPTWPPRPEPVPPPPPRRPALGRRRAGPRAPPPAPQRRPPPVRPGGRVGNPPEAAPLRGPRTATAKPVPAPTVGAGVTFAIAAVPRGRPLNTSRCRIDSHTPSRPRRPRPGGAGPRGCCGRRPAW